MYNAPRQVIFNIIFIIAFPLINSKTVSTYNFFSVTVKRKEQNWVNIYFFMKNSRLSNNHIYEFYWISEKLLKYNKKTENYLFFFHVSM